MILDTNAVSALSFEDDALLKTLGGSLRHHLPVIVIGEYEYGVASSKRRVELSKWFALLIAESVLLPIDRETAGHYGAICAMLKRSGTPIPSNDAWIAALAVQHGLPVVTRDQHFDAVRQARKIRW